MCGKAWGVPRITNGMGFLVAVGVGLGEGVAVKVAVAVGIGEGVWVGDAVRVRVAEATVVTVALGVGVSVCLATGAARKSGGRISNAPKSTIRITIITKIGPVIPMRGMRLRLAMLGMEAIESWELFRLRARTGFCGLTA